MLTAGILVLVSTKRTGELRNGEISHGHQGCFRVVVGSSIYRCRQSGFDQDYYTDAVPRLLAKVDFRVCRLVGEW
jgi:hypothetical protein